jgi:photosystem II stability/assembly factor-like uncharacterized protein
MVESVGLGGGGAMYVPVISLDDPFVRFVACDMGGLYRSFDAGENWQLLDGHGMNGDTRAAVAFDTAARGAIYAYGGERGLRYSPDLGGSWGGNLIPAGWPQGSLVTAVAIDPAGRLFVGTTKGAHIRELSGAWLDAFGPADHIVGFVLALSAHIVATTAGVFALDANLGSPTPLSGLPNPLPAPNPDITDDTSIRSIAGGVDVAGQLVLYVTLPSVHGPNAVTDGTVYVSTDSTSFTRQNGGLDLAQGVAGQACTFPEYEHLAVSPTDPHTAYVSVCAVAVDANKQAMEYRLYKTVNAGARWDHVLNVDGSVPGVPAMPNVEPAWQDLPPFGWSNTGRARGLGTGRSARGGDHSVLFTNNAALYVSDDAGLSWESRYSHKAGPPIPQLWRSAGLEVTTTWRYYVSDDDPTLHFICYTDICFAVSTDGGRSWYPARPSDFNTIYELAFDTAAPAAGRRRVLWAAASNHHDLPYWGHLLDDPYIGDPSVWSGEVLRLADDGLNWTSFGTQLPGGGVVSIVRDNATPPNLWAAVWGSGVYQYNRATDQWQPRNTNLGIGANKHVYRLEWWAGRLYCLIAGRRVHRTNQPGQPAFDSDAFLDDPGGIWVSGDGGQTWNLLTNAPGGTAFAEALRHPRDFALDRNDPNRIYLAVADVPEVRDTAGTVLQTRRDGGLWMTADGGTTWNEAPSFAATVAASGLFYAVRPFAPFVDPHTPNKLWVTSEGSGTWVTEDVTAARPTWHEYRLPFLNTHRIRFAAGDDPAFHVLTFGAGVLSVERAVYFIDNRSAFSRFEAGTPTPATPTTFADAVFLVFDGFLPSELGIDSGTPAPQPTYVLRSTGQRPAGFALVNPRLQLEDQSLPADRPQRFTYVYDVEFTSTNDFPGAGEDFVDVTATKGWLVANTSFKLFPQPNPFMQDGPIPWLSDDTRVFSVTRNRTPPRGLPAFTGTSAANALTYLRTVIASFPTAPPAAGTSHPFDDLPAGADESRLDLREMDGTDPVYNFALARVRYTRPPVAPPPDPLRVFFRTFKTEATSLDYRASTYPILQNPPAWPVPGVGIGAGNEVVSIPYFDQPRATAQGQSLLEQTETAPQQIPAGAGEEWRFFGCLLDFNLTRPAIADPVPASTPVGPWPGAAAIQDLIRGHHQCLAVEVNYAPDPLDPTAVPPETPASSDNLAQRNLAISESANPGTPGSRTVQHTFEIQQTRRRRWQERERRNGDPVALWGRPDELLFRWNLPRGAHARLVLRDDDARTFLQLGNEHLAPETLAHDGIRELRCQTGDVTYVTLPETQLTIPALLSIELPASVRTDDRFGVVVHQISGESRAVVGTFELVVPVRSAASLLAAEEDKLAVFRHIQRRLGPEDRWAPVFSRYINEIAERVRGFGGNPDRILPSPNGSPHDRRPRWQSCLAALVLLALVVGLVLWLLLR